MRIRRRYDGFCLEGNDTKLVFSSVSKRSDGTPLIKIQVYSKGLTTQREEQISEPFWLEKGDRLSFVGELFRLFPSHVVKPLKDQVPRGSPAE